MRMIVLLFKHYLIISYTFCTSVFYACQLHSLYIFVQLAADYKNISSPKYEVLEAALSGMDGIYEMAKPYELPLSAYEVSGPSSHTIATSLEVEQQIYETPFEDEESYGPIYYEPPSSLLKIYEEFEGKKFHKLYHHEIRFCFEFL